MNKQFQKDIIFSHKLIKQINSEISLGEVSISWFEIKDKINELIWNKRKILLEQLKNCEFNKPKK